MSDWTFGDVKVRNMEIVALCEREGCRHLFTFDLDQLIEGAGADYKVADIPPMTCPACGAGTPRHSPLLRRAATPRGRRLTLRMQENGQSFQWFAARR